MLPKQDILDWMDKNPAGHIFIIVIVRDAVGDFYYLEVEKKEYLRFMKLTDIPEYEGFIDDENNLILGDIYG